MMRTIALDKIIYTDLQKSRNKAYQRRKFQFIHFVLILKLASIDLGPQILINGASRLHRPIVGYGAMAHIDVVRALPQLILVGEPPIAS